MITRVPPGTWETLHGAARDTLGKLVVVEDHWFEVLKLRFLTPPDQIAARYSLGCDCRSCLASTFRPAGVSIFSASSFSSRCSAS